MRLLFKQRMFSWFDSYDIYDETGNSIYTVKGQPVWEHRLKIFDVSGNEVDCVKEKVLTLLPKFELYENDTCLGCVRKEFTLLKPRYDINFSG